MDNKYLKSGLIKVFFLTLVFLALLVILSIWDQNTGVLEEVAEYWFK